MKDPLFLLFQVTLAKLFCTHAQRRVDQNLREIMQG